MADKRISLQRACEAVREHFKQCIDTGEPLDPVNVAYDVQEILRNIADEENGNG